MYDMIQYNEDDEINFIRVQSFSQIIVPHMLNIYCRRYEFSISVYLLLVYLLLVYQRRCDDFIEMMRKVKNQK